MKHYLLLSFAIFSVPMVTMAHDDALHTEVWYQFVSLPVLLGILTTAVVVVGASYYLRSGVFVSAGLGIMVLTVGLIGSYYSTMQVAPVEGHVAEQLQGVPMTLYRSPNCGCCSVYAKELEKTGAQVTIETVDPHALQEIKDSHGISKSQESCHTTVVGEYVVEGHVPFAALAQLLDEQPDIAGIALPGMPIGTPGMPGRQTEVYEVQTVEGELFWTSS